MDAEVLKKANDLADLIAKLKEHKDGITGTHNGNPDRIKWKHLEIRPTDYSGDTNRQKLFDKFMPITPAELKELYLLKLDKAIEDYQNELNNL